MTPERELRNLLAKLFNADDLRRFLALQRQEQELKEALRVEGTLGQMFDDSVQALKRHNLIDQEFFAKLEEARPRCAAEIHTVRDLWLSSHHPGPPQRGRQGSPHRPKSAVLAVGCGLAVLLAVVAAVDELSRRSATDEIDATKKSAPEPPLQERVEPPSSAAVPSPERQTSEWWCLCYRRKSVGLAFVPETNCRRSESDCNAISGMTLKDRDDMLRGSLTHGCQYLGKLEHPGDFFNSREGWGPAGKAGTFLKTGACHLTNKGHYEITEADFMKNESLGGIPLIGLKIEDVLERLGDPDTIQKGSVVMSKFWRHDRWIFNKHCLELIVRTVGDSNGGVSSLKLAKVDPSTERCELTTAKGIGIGSSRSEVVRLYEPVLQKRNPLEVTIGSSSERMDIYFDVADTVESIHISTEKD